MTACTEPPPVRTMRLLIVEDNPSDLFFAQEILKEVGFPVDVDVVRDGDAAIAHLAQTGADGDALLPDLVLLDISLPRKSGFEVLGEIRADSRPSVNALPVVMVTHSGRPEDRETAESLGASAFFTKPLDPSRLAVVARELIPER